MLAQESNYILEGLNPAQIEAATNFKGPYKIAASAGSGKTMTIVRRVAYMIQQGVSPESILVFTFTRKAANEIKERLANFLGEQKSSLVNSGTYHSFCCKLIRDNIDFTAYSKNFSIYDDTDSTNLIKKIISGRKDISVSEVKSNISRLKTKMISPQQAAVNSETDRERDIANIYNEYQLTMIRRNSLDFDDIIYVAVKMLESNDLLKKRINNQYKYIIADENQDSSIRDISLISLLAGEQENVALVGDLNQSIYGFRGANPEAVLKISFSRPLKIINLEQNYRSTQTIVNAAENVIKNNPLLEDKTSFSKNKVGEKIKIYRVPEPIDQSSKVVEIILNERSKGRNFSDIAILYRTAYNFSSIEYKLVSNNIPYEIYNGISFCNKREIKDIICYIKFLVNPYDLESMDRIINIPKRGIGEVNRKKIYEYIDNLIVTKDTAGDILKNITDNLSLTPKAKEGLKDFIVKYFKMKENMNKSPDELIKYIIDLIEYDKHLLNICKEDDEYNVRISNIEKLIYMAEQYDNINDLLYSLTLNEQVDDCDDSGKVKSMTIHSSKGLEFPVVIIIDCIQGNIPYYKSVQEGHIDEERRLFYVALTRAKEQVYITYYNMRMSYGDVIPCKQSDFIQELGESNVKIM